MMDFLFGLPIGCAARPEQLRPCGQEDLAVLQLRSMQAQQQTLNKYYNMSNYFRQPADPRSLDERFADFKRRLADAVERNERRKG